MKRNIFLIVGTLAAVLLGFNSFKRIMEFRATEQKVEQADIRLEKLRVENESLQAELKYKSSEGFAEQEIRDKLGLAKPNEAIVILPREKEDKTGVDSNNEKQNWEKWKELFFGS